MEERAEHTLRPYLTRIAALAPGGIKKKEINDAVWGTLGLEPHEIVVLDSPLLQRLQRIRQLGVVHLVYPSARHSRLEHCIGVMHQVSKIVDAVNEAAPADARIDPAIRRTLRLAALVHDIGHGVMSHVSENAINNADVVALRLAFQNEHGTDSERQLSEIAAYYMVRSAAFAELLERAARIGGVPEGELLQTVSAGSSQRAQHIANAIIGKMFDEKFPMAHELISGPFDADKMDYMARDAKMTGIPVVTDFTRLTQKLRAATIPATALPSDLARSVDVSNGSVLVVGVTRTGRRALDEMALGRVLMFDKVYRHHKVRASEMMVKAVINAGLRHLTDAIEKVPYLYHDEQLLDVTAMQLERDFHGDVDAALRAEFVVAEDIASRLRDRNLFVRAYEFGVTAQPDTQKQEVEGSEEIDQLLRNASEYGANEKLVRTIADEAREIAHALGEDALIERFGGQLLWHYIKVDAPRAGDISADASSARTFLIEDGAMTVLDNSVAQGTNAWAEAYTNIRNLGFVFSPRELAAIVHVAAELVIKRSTGMHPYAPEQLVSLRQADNARAIKQALEAAGYESKNAGRVRAESVRIHHADIQRLIVETADHFATYSPPASTEETEPGLSVDRITRWVLQFPDPLKHAALLMASEVRVLSRIDATRAVRKFETTFTSFDSFNATPLGTVKDGSSIVGYHSRDAKRADGSQLRLLELRQALEEDTPILFVDDFIGLGNSVVSILRGWFGEEPDVDLREERAELSDDDKQRLRGREIGFSFIAGLTDGEGALNDELVRLGFVPRVSVLLSETAIPTLGGLRESHPTEPWDELEGFLRDVAASTLADGDPRHDTAWVNERLLGYGNLGKLLASTFNTPTITVTGLWSAGDHDGSPWHPLLPRLKKP